MAAAIAGRLPFATDPRAMLLNFEDRFYERPETIDRLAALPPGTLSDDARIRIFLNSRREFVELFIAGLENLPTFRTEFDQVTGHQLRFDQVTQWHKHHSGRKAEIGRWRPRQIRGQEVQALRGAAAHHHAADARLRCRAHGAAWRVLSEGVDTIRDVPADRWDARAHYDADPDRPGKLWTLAGGFLDDVAGFDAAFFDITPREATRMDPQQRIFLETAWHALEDAGLPKARIAGADTGVFVGIHNHSADYSALQFEDLQAMGGCQVIWKTRSPR